MTKRDLMINMITHQIGNYSFKNSLLLEQAFTRRSYAMENGGDDNEILEFIGDKALDLCVVRYLTNRFGNNLHIEDEIPPSLRVPNKKSHKTFKSQLDEGELTKLKQRMVEKKALASRIDELGIAQFMRVGKGDKAKNLIDEPSVKEDLFEAIIGAVALDSNWDFDKIYSTVEVMLNPDSFLEGEEADYVGLIYEWEEKKYGLKPWFKFFDHGFPVSAIDSNIIRDIPQGTYNMNHWNHACQVHLLDRLPVFEAYGPSNHEARKNACKMAYAYLEVNNELLGIKDEIPDPNINDAINQLEILARRGYFSLPNYEYEETHDDNGNPVWTVKCSIEEKEKSFSAVTPSKKTAKKEAAFKMLQYVLDNYEEE